MPLRNQPVNWSATPGAKRLQQQRQESVAFLDRLLSGEDLGFVPTMDQWGQILSIIGQAGQQYGWDNVAPAWQRWVEPAIQGNLPQNLRHQAMNLLAQQSATAGQIDPRVTGWLSQAPASTAGVRARSNVLSDLMELFHGEPWYQDLYRQFMQRVAPGIGNQSVPYMAAAAQPYFQMQSMAPGFAQQVGAPHFPTDPTNQSAPMRNLIDAITQAGMASQGQVMGPQGPVEMSPMDHIRQLFSGVPGAIPYWQPLNAVVPGAEPGSLPPAGPGSFAPMNPITNRVIEEAQKQNRLQQLGNWLRNVFSNVSIGQPPPSPEGLSVQQLRAQYQRPSDLLRELRDFVPQNEQEAQMIQQLRTWLASLLSHDQWPQ